MENFNEFIYGNAFYQCQLTFCTIKLLISARKDTSSEFVEGKYP